MKNYILNNPNYFSRNELPHPKVSRNSRIHDSRRKNLPEAKKRQPSSVASSLHHAIESFVENHTSPNQRDNKRVTSLCELLTKRKQRQQRGRVGQRRRRWMRRRWIERWERWQSRSWQRRCRRRSLGHLGQRSLGRRHLGFLNISLRCESGHAVILTQRHLGHLGQRHLGHLERQSLDCMQLLA